LIRTYKYRIYPNKKHVGLLNSGLGLCRCLYNCALEHRIWVYQATQGSVTYREQQDELPGIKEDNPAFKEVHSQVLQDVLKRLDRAFAAFFRRVKTKEEPGFPRFKGKDRFSSICYTQSGFRLKGNRIDISKIGEIKIKLHRPIEGRVKTCTIKKSGSHWYVTLVAEQQIRVGKDPVDRAVGIDLGLSSFAVLSDGEVIENPRYLKKSGEKLKEIQRIYSKSKGKRTKRKLASLHRKIANQRNDFLHKTSRMLVNKYGMIVYEDLDIKQMMMEGKHAKGIADVSWGKFIKNLNYKAASAGSYAMAVNPQYTTQQCSGCGRLEKKAIWERQHNCPECGLSIHRDLNASKNILRSGIGLLEERALPANQQSHVL
jgi:putative transposase